MQIRGVCTRVLRLWLGRRYTKYINHRTANVHTQLLCPGLLSCLTHMIWKRKYEEAWDHWKILLKALEDSVPIICASGLSYKVINIFTWNLEIPSNFKNKMEKSKSRDHLFLLYSFFPPTLVGKSIKISRKLVKFLIYVRGKVLKTSTAMQNVRAQKLFHLMFYTKSY